MPEDIIFQPADYVIDTSDAYSIGVSSLSGDICIAHYMCEACKCYKPVIELEFIMTVNQGIYTTPIAKCKECAKREKRLKRLEEIKNDCL